MKFLNAAALLCLLIIGSMMVLVIAPSASAYITPTSCGTSSDGGAWGLIQFYEGGPPNDQVYGDAKLNSYYGYGYATLYGYLDGSFYVIAQHNFTGAGQEWSITKDYNTGYWTGYITVYDGNSNRAAGTFTGVIFNNSPNPVCPYQVPVP